MRTKYLIAKNFGIPLNIQSIYFQDVKKGLGEKIRERARKPENPDINGCILKRFKQSSIQQKKYI